MKKLPLLLIPLLMAVAAACSDDEPAMPTPIDAMEIVTVERPSSPALMLGQRTDASPVMPMQADGFAFNEKVNAGDRVLIWYNAAVTDTVRRPVPVTIRGYARIPYARVAAMTMHEISLYPPSQLQTLSVWKTGDYINMQVLMRYDNRPKSFTLVADRATVDTDTVTLYIVGYGETAGDAYVERRVYGSFDVSQVVRPGQGYRIINRN